MNKREKKQKKEVETRDKEETSRRKDNTGNR